MVLLDQVPPGGRWVRSWDVAGTTGRWSDWTVAALVGRVAGKTVVANVVRFKGTGAQVKARMAEIARGEPGVPVLLEQEGGSAGLGMANEFKEAILNACPNATVRIVRPRGDKQTRAAPFGTRLEAGGVAMLRAGWNGVVLGEMRSFPNGPHDDCVDAIVAGHNLLVDQERAGVDDELASAGPISVRVDYALTDERVFGRLGRVAGTGYVPGPSSLSDPDHYGVEVVVLC